MEQFLTTQPADLSLWIRERNPKAVADAAELADQFAQAHKQSQEERRGAAHRREDLLTRRCFKCEKAGHLQRDKASFHDKEEGKGPRPREGQEGSRQDNGWDKSERQPKQRPEMKCYNCGKKGHISTRCPERCSLGKMNVGAIYRQGWVEGKQT